VPHPHIKFETEKYRRRQDVLADFLAQRLVSVPDSTQQFPMDFEIAKYITWYAKNQNGSLPAKGIIDTMRNNSTVGKFIKNTKRGFVIQGNRFLDANETLGEGEEFVVKDVFDLVMTPDPSVLVETPEEYYERICKEYDQHKHMFVSDPQYDIDVSMQVIYDKIDGKDDIKQQAQPVLPPREDNVEYLNGRVLPSGIILKNREESTYASNHRSYLKDCEGFLPDDDSDEEIDE